MKYKSFVLLTLGTSVIILLFNLVIMEVFARKILVSNDIIYIKEQLLLERKKEILTIGLGDSHVNQGLYFYDKSGFNFGNGGDPTPIMYFKLKWLLKNGFNIENLLLQFDYHMFSYYRTQPGNDILHYARIIDERVEEKLGNYPSPNSFIFYSLIDSYSPIVHKAFINYILGNFSKPNVSNNGHYSTDRNWIKKGDKVRALRTKIRVKEQLYNKYLIDTNLVNYYEKVIKLALERNINVILIRFPLTNKYLDLIDKEVENNFHDLLISIKNRYNLPVLDYRYIFHNKQNLFADQDHLNNTGAKELGKIITNTFAHGLVPSQLSQLKHVGL